MRRERTLLRPPENSGSIVQDGWWQHLVDLVKPVRYLKYQPTPPLI
jgi:hypothetical protein